MEKTTTQIGVRVTAEFKEALEQQAEKEHRSLSNLIVKVMLDYLNEQHDSDSTKTGSPT